jgi:hypothetical protein
MLSKHKMSQKLYNKLMTKMSFLSKLIPLVICLLGIYTPHHTLTSNAQSIHLTKVANQRCNHATDATLCRCLIICRRRSQNLLNLLN